MKILPQMAVACAILAIGTASSFSGELKAQDVLEQIKSFSGTWTGSAIGEGEAAKHEEEHSGDVVHEFRVSANGSVVMETMNPGTPHEMINMYHVDGDDLLLTHYCAAGNQPQMRLDLASSTASKLVFDFVGGTNMDPAVDQHIHSAEMRITSSKHIESAWVPFVNGEAVGSMTFHLSRSK